MTSATCQSAGKDATLFKATAADLESVAASSAFTASYATNASPYPAVSMAGIFTDRFKNPTPAKN